MTDTPKHASLVEALLAFQAEAPDLHKDKNNPAFRGVKYLSLDALTDAVRPLLTKHGLVWIAQPDHIEGPNGPAPSLRYELLHAEGMIAGNMPLMLSKQDAQGQGSAITYARRYALMAVLGLVADEDDDGNRASKSARQPSVPDAPKREALASPAQQKHLMDLSDGLLLAQNDLADAICDAMGTKLPRELTTLDEAYDWCQRALAKLPAKMVGVVETKLRKMVGQKEAVAS